MRFAIRRALPPMDRLRGFRVVRKARWVEVQLVFERPLPEVRTGVPERPVGLDVGIRTFAMLSDGESLPATAEAGGTERDPQEAARGVPQPAGIEEPREEEGGACTAHERMAEAGRQELHRHADWIVRTYDFIAVEALKIGNMLRRGPGKRGLNRAISEQGWREFFDILKCKAESAGIPFVEVPPAGTSQECSRCGTKVPKALSERTHQCDVCGLELDHDENAARNVLCRGLRIFAGTAAAGGTAQALPRFRSALHAGVEDPADSACAVRRAAPHCIAHNTLHSLHFSTAEIRSGPSSGPQNCVSETLANRCDESVASECPRHASARCMTRATGVAKSIPCQSYRLEPNRYPTKGGRRMEIILVNLLLLIGLAFV